MPPQLTDPYRVALVGFGLAGKAFHAPLIAASPGLDLAAIVTSRVEEVRSLYPAAAAGRDYAEVLADPAIALVVLATPDHLHAEHALAAIAAGKHLVIDKPLAPSLAEARGIAAAARLRGTMLSVFHNRRWDGDFLTLRHLIDTGQLGDITEFDSHFDKFRTGPGGRWKDQRAGGVWQDLGPHLVDQALVLFGRPLAVSADLAVLLPGGQAPDYARVTLRYPAARVNLHMSQTRADHGLRLSVHGTKASFIKHGLDTQEEQSKAGMLPANPQWGTDPQPGQLTRTDGTCRVEALRGNYGAYYAGVADALAGTAPPPVTATEALAVMEVIEAGLTSHAERREIRMAQG